MPVCDICHKNVPRYLSKHRQYCIAFDRDQPNDADPPTGNLQDQVSLQDTAHHASPEITFERSNSAPQTLEQGYQARKRRRIPTLVDDNLDVDLDYGHQDEEPTAPSLYCFSYHDDDQDDGLEDIDFLLQHYFDDDDDVEEQEAYPGVRNENGIQVIDLQDPPTPSEKDYWNHRLSNIAHDGKFSRASHEAIIEFCNEWRTSNNYRPEPLDTVYMAIRRVEAAFPVQSQMFDICQTGCKLFYEDGEHTCPYCSKPRYTDNDLKRPVARMRYLPLSELIAAMLVTRSHRDMFRETYSREPTGSFTDIFDGHAFADQEHLFQNEFDVALALYVDGFSPFSFGRTSVSMTIIHLVVLNLPRDQRYKLENMLEVAIIPGPVKPKDIHSFLKPLMSELRRLSTEGMRLRVDGEDEIHLHAYLLLASGDVPGVADLIKHTGHGSRYGCRMCRIKSESLISPKGKGYGQYFAGDMEDMDELRTDSDFMGELPDYGISDSNVFTELLTYHSPFFYGIDEFHLLGQNVARQILAMLKDQYANADSTLALTSRQQSDIGKALKASHLLLPLGLDGDLGDIFARSKSSRAVDFIDFLLYALPTVVYEQLEANECSFTEELISLVNACSIALQWDISCVADPPEYEGSEEFPSDIERLKGYIHEWHTFMHESMPHNLYTISMHYLRHLPSAIEALGPPRSFSARSMERAVGEIKSYIKSKVAPGPNASNALVKIAASRYYNRQLPKDSVGKRKAKGFFHLGGKEHDAEFWGPILKDVPMSKYQQQYNLQYYVKNFWSRETQKPVNNVCQKLDIVAPKLYIDDKEYDCLAFPNNRAKRLTHFITVMLPVDLNAKKPRVAPRNVWRRFFGDILLFFVHSYEGSTKMLCLLNIIENVNQNGAGAAFGTTLQGTKRYVTAVENIEGFAGMMKSSLHSGRYYYLYPGMDVGKMKLGSSRDHL